MKPPCSLYQSFDHGVRFCREFYDRGMDDCWKIAKEKKLCFHCLASDHRGKDCTQARTYEINVSSRNHHRLLRGSEVLSETGPITVLPHADDGKRPDFPREGALAMTLTSCNTETPTQSYSLQIFPVWMKTNGRKIKINAMLDDASNKTFQNEAVAEILGLQEPFGKVQVYVLSDSVETFKSMPIKLKSKVQMAGFQRKQAQKRVCRKSLEITEL